MFGLGFVYRIFNVLLDFVCISNKRCVGKHTLYALKEIILLYNKYLTQVIKNDNIYRIDSGGAIK